jgi:uncharacterized protein (DUF58 family)
LPQKAKVAPRANIPPLDMRLLAELPSLELQARYLVEGLLCGQHRSPQKGSSVEFAEYRAYQRGDDLRRVDWRLYGRSNRLQVKQYEDETQLRICLVLDTSLSMQCSSQPKGLSKLAYARLILAAIGLLAKRQGDAFGLALVGSRLHDFLKPRASAAHWSAAVGRLEWIQPSGTTALASCLEEVAELLPPRSLVFVASDFYEESAPLAAALRRLRYDHHEVVGLQVLDPIEVDFELESAGNFVDMETGSRLLLDAPAVRRGYLARFGKFCAELETLFLQTGGELIRLRTDQPPLPALSNYLAHRAQRL